MNAKLLRQWASHGAVAAVAAIALAGCDVMVGLGGGIGGGEKAQNEWQRSYSLAAGGTVDIVSPNGPIDVQATDGTTVLVRAERTASGSTAEAAREHLQQIEMREEVSQDRVRIEVRLPRSMFGSRASVALTVQVPRQAGLRLVGTNGKVSVTGVTGPVTAETTNGSIVGHALEGSVEATTTNGSVSVEVNAVAPGGIRLGATNGSVSLTLPAAAKADLSASCLNGAIRTSNLTLDTQEQSFRRRLTAKLNGGGPLIDLDVTNGAIRITGR